MQNAFTLALQLPTIFNRLKNIQKFKHRIISETWAIGIPCTIETKIASDTEYTFIQNTEYTELYTDTE